MQVGGAFVGVQRGVVLRAAEMHFADARFRDGGRGGVVGDGGVDGERGGRVVIVQHEVSASRGGGERAVARCRADGQRGFSGDDLDAAGAQGFRRRVHGGGGGGVLLERADAGDAGGQFDVPGGAGFIDAEVHRRAVANDAQWAARGDVGGDARRLILDAEMKGLRGTFNVGARASEETGVAEVDLVVAALAEAPVVMRVPAFDEPGGIRGGDSAVEGGHPHADRPSRAGLPERKVGGATFSRRRLVARVEQRDFSPRRRQVDPRVGFQIAGESARRNRPAIRAKAGINAPRNAALRPEKDGLPGSDAEEIPCRSGRSLRGRGAQRAVVK